MVVNRPSRRLEKVEAFVRRRLGSIEHEQRVRLGALALFDLTAHRHGLDEGHRRLLELGAILHDVGRCIEDEGHERHGAKLIAQAKGLRLDPAAGRALAFLTRYHRGKVAAVGEEKYLDDGDDRPALRMLLALLRAADALDGRSLESPELRMLLWRDRLHIECRLARDCPRARWAYTRRKKFRLLEELMGIEVEIGLVVERGASLHLAA